MTEIYRIGLRSVVIIAVIVIIIVVIMVFVVIIPVIIVAVIPVVVPVIPAAADVFCVAVENSACVGVDVELVASVSRGEFKRVYLDPVFRIQMG